MKYSRSFNVTTNDFDRYDRLRPYSILEHFQEVAGIHAKHLGVGFEDSLNKGYIWVILRVKYDMIRYPKGRTLTYNTWPMPTKRVDFDRDYQCLDESSNVIIKGRSKWCVIDVKNRKILRASTVGLVIEDVVESNYHDEFDKIESIEKKQLHFSHQVKVYSSSLDHNNHLNNAKYADYVLDALSLSETEVIKNFQIDFIKEAKLDDCITIYHSKNDTDYRVFGYLDDNELCFQAKVIITGELYE